MSRSCQSATFSSPTCALPRSTRARPQMRSQTTGLRLCGIALEPFWPLPERLLDLAHLGALQVADLGREALQAGAGQRDRADSSSAWRSRGTTWVEIGLVRQAELRQHALLVVRAERRVGADRAGDRRRDLRRTRARAARRCGATPSRSPRA